MNHFSIETTPLIIKTNKELQNKQNNKQKNFFSYFLYFLSFLFFSFFFIIIFYNSNITSYINNFKLKYSSSSSSSSLSNDHNIETVSVYKNTFTNRYEIIRGRKDLQSDAIGTFQINIEGGGWNYLEIEATPQDDSMDKYLQSMKAMGYIEGYLTWQQIEQYYPNYYQGMFDTEDPQPVDPDIRVQQYLIDNFKWMSEKSKAKCYESAHWLTVRGIVEQLEGLLDGFIDGRQEYQRIHRHSSTYDDDDNNNNHSNNIETNPNDNNSNTDPYSRLNGNTNDNTHLTTLNKPYLLHFLILNGNGDLIQITEKIAAMDEAVKAALEKEKEGEEEGQGGGKDDNDEDNKDEEIQSKKRKMKTTTQTTTTLKSENDLSKITPLSLMKSKRSEDHCSAFIKVFPDQSDVVFAHNTWDDYRNMAPRIFKHYIFPAWPTELKKEERKKDTYLRYTAQPSSSSHHKKDSKKQKKENKKEEEEESNDKDNKDIIDDKDHCLCPLTQYSKTIDKSDQSDGNTNSYQYHFSPHSYFSSSPGILTSVDDFYTTYTSPNIHIEENKNKNCYCEGPGGRLGIMETSLDVKSPNLYDKIVPQSLLSWIRVRSANLIAIDGNDWVSRFSYDHSGTYANQWMVIDFTKFHEVDTNNINSNTNQQKVLDDGFLTIVEEMPGMIHSGDETQHILTNGYWASYNEPYYKELADYSGNTEYCESTRIEYAATHDINDIYGLWPGEVNCFDTCSRARLFNRLQSSVHNIHDAMSLITYNNYKQDKESFGDSCESISCREDLEPNLDEIRAFGAIDAKVSSILRSDIYRDISSPQRPISHASVSSFHHIYPREPEFFIHQGPTSSGLEPFCWDKFETKQNNYYDSIQNLIKNKINQVGNILQSNSNIVDDDDNNDNNNSNKNNNNQINLRGLLNNNNNNNANNANKNHHDRNSKLNDKEKDNAPQRHRRPSIQYNHEGHPNCFDYDWVIVPPDNTKL